MRNNVPDGDPSALVPPAGVEERAGGPTGRALIEQLRASIRALEQVPVSLATPPAPGAAPSRSACSLTSPSPSNDNRDSPLKALLQGGLHEIKPHAYRDTPAGLGFILSVVSEALTNCRGLVLWCLTRTAAREWGRPYGPGLLRAGLDPARFLVVETDTPEESAWALEEGLKSGALAGCLAQLEVKTPLTARRLGLAAQAARTPCLLLSPHGTPGVPGTLTRWRIATEGSAHVPFDTGAPGTACWRLSLERCRGGAPGARFHVEAGHGDEADGLRVAPRSSDRAADAGARADRQHTAAG
jgi:protein ImuA